MRFPFVLSIFLHLFALLVAVYGLPNWTNETIDIPPPILVELVEVEEKNQTTKIALPPKQPPKEEVKKPEEDKPKPKPSVAKPSIIEENEPEISEKAVPLPDKKTKKESPPKKQTKKIKPKTPLKKPKLKSTKPIQKDESKKDTDQFQSILKNLVGEDEPFSVKEDKTEDQEKAQSETSQIASLSDRMTISETDALRRQLEGCWNVPIGARDADGLVVDVKITVNPDKTVRDVKVVDQSRYNTDFFFRAAADSATRAVLSKDCNPLILPDGKHNQWKTITFRFNPQEMF